MPTAADFVSRLWPTGVEKADDVLPVSLCLAERLAKALGDEDTDEQEDDPVVLGFFR